MYTYILLYRHLFDIMQIIMNNIDFVSTLHKGILNLD